MFPGFKMPFVPDWDMRLGMLPLLGGPGLKTPDSINDSEGAASAGSAETAARKAGMHAANSRRSMFSPGILEDTAETTMPRQSSIAGALCPLWSRLNRGQRKTGYLVLAVVGDRPIEQLVGFHVAL